MFFWKCANPAHAEEVTAVQQELQKKRLELETPTRRSQGQRCSTREKRPILGTRWPRIRSNSRHNHPGWRRHVNRDGPLLTSPRGFPFLHSPKDLHAQLRRVPRTGATQLSLDPHAVSPHSTQTMTHMWWKILCPLWTLIAPRPA